MSVWLEALRIFRSRNNLYMREKYEIIYHKNVDNSCDFNPNNDHLYFLTVAEYKDAAKSETSPWHCFTLIPETLVTGESSLDSTLKFMHFLNWAIYHNKELNEAYANILNDYRSKDLIEAKKQSTIYAFIIELIEGKRYTDEEIERDAKKSFKKNTFPLKPALFLKLCRFFARAWYDEMFGKRNSSLGSVGFSHYVSNYIISDKDSTCKRYDGNNGELKKEVGSLFKDGVSHNYKFKRFNIDIKKYDNKKYDNKPSDPQGHYSYSIAIGQIGCGQKNGQDRLWHEFYLYARLHQDRYISLIDQMSVKYSGT